MAGDWIPFFIATSRKPEIVTLASRLSVIGAQVVGHAVELWCYASEHSVDGFLPLMTVETLAQAIQAPQEFVAGMVEVGWLHEVAGGLQVPNAEWLTKGGKSRMQAAKRQAKRRSDSCHASVTHERDNSVTREEKRRVEKSKDITPLTPQGGNPLVVPEAFRTGEVQDAIERWRAYRAEAKLRAWKPTTWAAQFGKLTPERFIAAVNHSIAHGYQGLYEPKENSNGNRPGKILAGAGQVHDADRQRAVGQF